jgi:hypothetical protein
VERETIERDDAQERILDPAKRDVVHSFVARGEGASRFSEQFLLVVPHRAP